MAKSTGSGTLENSEVKVPLTNDASEVNDVNGRVKSPEVEYTSSFTPPDGGWGWVVCITSLWTNGTVFGIINTFGIIYVYMRKEFAQDNPSISFKTSFVGSACTGITFFMCIVASISSDRFGIRRTAFIGGLVGFIGLLSSAFVEQLELLYLTYGVFLGLGSAFAYSPSLVILGHYFKKHMGLVNGIVSFGSSIFTIILSIVLPILLEKIKIKYTFLFLSGLEFMLMVCALTWKPVVHKESELAGLTLSTESVYEHCTDCCSWTRKFLNVRIWRNKAYVVWATSLGVCLFGYFVPFFHLVKHTQDIFPESDGSMLVLCLSITSGISRILAGKLADFKCVNRIHMQQIAFVIMGAATACIPLSASFEGLIAICLVMGICDGIFVCLLGPIAFDIVGPREASQAIGFLLGIFSIPFTVGPPIAGLLYDHLGSYQIAFHAAGVPPILGAVMMFFIPKVTQVFPGATNAEDFASISALEDDHYRVKRSTLRGPSGPATEILIMKDGTISELIPSQGDKNSNMNNGIARHNQANGVTTDPEEVGLLESAQLENDSLANTSKHKVAFVTFKPRKDEGKEDINSENIDIHHEEKLNDANDVDTDSLAELSSEDANQLDALRNSPETDI